MKAITVHQAIDNLLATYSRFGATREIISKGMIEGITTYGLSPLSAYNVLRMSLGEEFGVPETFSVEDCAEMCDISEEEVRKEVENMIDTVNARGEDITKYLRPIAPPKKFIINPSD